MSAINISDHLLAYRIIERNLSFNDSKRTLTRKINFQPQTDRAIDVSSNCTNAFKIDNLPDEIIYLIFIKLISNSKELEAKKDLESFSLCSRRLHKISESDRIWLKLAKLSSYDKDFDKYQTETSDFSNKELYHLTKSARLIHQLPNPESQASAQLELIKVFPDNLELFSRSRLREISKAREYIDKITDSHFKAKTQLELVKLNYCKIEIGRAKLFIDQIDDPTSKCSAKIKLLSVYARFKNIDKAEALRDQTFGYCSDSLFFGCKSHLDAFAVRKRMYNLNCRLYQAYEKVIFEMPQTLLDEINRAKVLMNQIIDLKDKALAKEEFKKAYPHIGEKQEAEMILWHASDPDKSLFHEFERSLTPSLHNDSYHSQTDKNQEEREYCWNDLALPKIKKIQDPYLKVLALNVLQREIELRQIQYPSTRYNLSSNLEVMKENASSLTKAFALAYNVKKKNKRRFLATSLSLLPDEVDSIARECKKI